MTDLSFNKIAIVALGPSSLQYIPDVESKGNRYQHVDQTWAVNSYASVIQSDLIWAMDDLKVQEVRATAKPGGKIDSLLKFLRTTKTPFMTSVANADYPASVAFPLQEAINTFKTMYFNSTVAYAIAYAIMKECKELHLYGIDFTFPNQHEAEKGRACVEYWIGRATERKCNVFIAQTSTLMDTNEGPPDQRLYGYDGSNLKFGLEPKTGLTVAISPKTVLPTAAQMEAKYDHGEVK